MKKRTASILVVLLLAVFTTSAQSTSKKLNPVGTWKFEAPYAPEGYTTGTITVGTQEKAYTASISFTGNEYKIPGEKVKFKADSLQFTVYIDGGEIGILLKMEPENTMTGKALSPDGEIPLTLKREEPNK